MCCQSGIVCDAARQTLKVGVDYKQSPEKASPLNVFIGGNICRLTKEGAGKMYLMWIRSKRGECSVKSI